MISTYEKANRGKLLAVVAVLAMVLCAFAAFAPAETDAAANEQSYSGTLDATQSFPASTNVVISDKTIITSEAGKLIVEGNLRVAEGVTLTIEKGASLEVKGGFFQVDGNIVVTGEGSKIIVSGVENPDYTKEGVVVNGGITVTKGASFATAEDTTGRILINDGGVVSVERSGNTAATISGLNVDVAVGGTFNLQGIVSSAMSVSSYQGNAKEYTVATATVTPGQGSGSNRIVPSDLTFTTTSSNVTGYSYADGKTATTSVKEFALNVAGTVNNGDTVTFAGADYIGSNSYTSADAAENQSQKYDAKIVGKVIVGDLSVAETGAVDIEGYVQVDGKLDVTANDKNDIADGKLTIDGTLVLVGTLTGDYVAGAQNAPGNITGTGLVAVNGGTATIDGAYAVEDIGVDVYGAYYGVSGSASVFYITSIDAAITGAVAEDEYAYVSSGKSALECDAYAVSADLIVPDNATLVVVDNLAVAEGVTLTVSVEGIVQIEGMLYVYGTVVDNSLGLYDYEKTNMDFEVKSVSEDEMTYTYTSLANALAGTESGTIYLYSDVTVSGTMTIKQNVTVQFAADEDLAAENLDAAIGFKDKNATLVVDGTLVIGGSHVLNPAVKDDFAKVTVNNMIKFQGNGSLAAPVDGVYFSAQLGEDDETTYLTSVAVAAANSAEIPEYIAVYGNVAMGDVTFTKGEDVQDLAVVILNVGEDDVTTGNITLANGTEFVAAGNFTGSVTDGTNTVQFTKSANVAIGFHTEETADGTTSEMCITSISVEDVLQVITGDVVIAAGTVTVQNAEVAEFADLTIASGATLEVSGTVTVYAADYKANLIPKELPVYTESAVENTFASLFVEGALNVAEGGNVYGAIAVIDGTVSVAENAGTVDIDGALVNGTVTAAKAVAFDIAIVNGTIDGEANVQALIAKNGASVVADDINAGNAEATTVYINGEAYATVYAVAGTPVTGIMIFADVPGVQPASAVFYYDEAMTQVIPGIDIASVFQQMATNNDYSIRNLIQMLDFDVDVGAYDNVYVSMDPAEVEGTVSVGTGLDLYIDNVRTTGGQDFVLTVGTHTVSFDVKAGYDGANATITFNGQTVQNGGTITVTADMTEYTLVASGAAPSQGQVVIDDGADSGMGVTDYLLIILVVLVIVLAIVVVMRMMRS